MIRSYITENGKIVPSDVIYAENCWVRLTIPTEEEISDVARKLNIDVTDVRASLDRDEGSRIEHEEDETIMIIDIPYMPESGSSPYNTIPFAIIRSGKNIVTVSQTTSDIIDKFISNSKCDLNDKLGFILKLIYAFSIEYQKDLRDINNRRREIETNLNNKTKNQDIIDLHRLESSLVYFVTSLRACNVILDKMKRYYQTNMDKTHLDLLHDVIIENEQAVEMATTYREVIDGTRELFVAVANNKLNDVMKWLTAVTIILSIPMIIAGIYGMNVELPLATDSFAFWYLIAGTILICFGLTFWLKRRQLI